MRWYVVIGNETTGPFEVDSLVELAKQKRIDLNTLVRDEFGDYGHDWVPLWNSPLLALTRNARQSSAAPAPPLSAAPVSGRHRNSNAFGWFLLAIPFVAGMLMWGWVAQITILQGSASSLLLLGFGSVVLTAIFAAAEANQVGMGSREDLTQEGKPREGPVAWFFGHLIIWIIAYPMYLYRRRLYGLRNHLASGLIVALFFVFSWFAVGNAIDSRFAEIRRTSTSTGSTFQTSAPRQPQVLRISRSELEAAFVELGFKFKNSTLDDGTPARIAIAPNSPLITLAGHGDAFASASLVFNVNGDDEQQLKNVTALVALLEQTGWVPWKDGSDWITAHVNAGTDGVTIHNGVRYEVVAFGNGAPDRGTFGKGAFGVIAKPVNAPASSE